MCKSVNDTTCGNNGWGCKVVPGQFPMSTEGFGCMCSGMIWLLGEACIVFVVGAFGWGIYLFFYFGIRRCRKDFDCCKKNNKNNKKKNKKKELDDKKTNDSSNSLEDV